MDEKLLSGTTFWRGVVVLALMVRDSMPHLDDAFNEAAARTLTNSAGHGNGWAAMLLRRGSGR